MGCVILNMIYLQFLANLLKNAPIGLYAPLKTGKLQLKASYKTLVKLTRHHKSIKESYK